MPRLWGSPGCSVPGHCCLQRLQDEGWECCKSSFFSPCPDATDDLGLEGCTWRPTLPGDASTGNLLLPTAHCPSPVRGRKPRLTALLSAEVGTSPLGYSLPSITASEGPYQQLVKSPGAAAASPRGGQWGAAGRAGEMKGTSRWWGLPGESWEDARTQLFPERPWDRA